MSLVWLLMLGPIYVGIVMGYLHPEHLRFVGGATLVVCVLLYLFGRKL